ncbi:acylphosphatase, partial [Candidatus Margulisiibacteriota bacterium]
MKRVQALYSGSVQGVGFRFTAIDAAQQHGLTGWVRNTPDGKVEL